MLSLGEVAQTNSHNVETEYADGDTIRVRLRFMSPRRLMLGVKVAGQLSGPLSPVASSNEVYSILTRWQPSGKAYVYKVVDTLGNADSVSITLKLTQRRYDNVTLVASNRDPENISFINLLTRRVGNYWTVDRGDDIFDLGFAIHPTNGGIHMSLDNWFPLRSFDLIRPSQAGAATTQLLMTGGAQRNDYHTISSLETAFRLGTGGTTQDSTWILDGVNNEGLINRINSRAGNLTTCGTILFRTYFRKYGNIHIIHIDHVNVNRSTLQGTVTFSYWVNL